MRLNKIECDRLRIGSNRVPNILIPSNCLYKQKQIHLCTFAFSIDQPELANTNIDAFCLIQFDKCYFIALAHFVVN